MARLLAGTARDETALERAVVGLARRTCESPASLTPDDLAPLRAVVGDGALDYVLVASGFHFINRIADLLHVDPEALPAPLRRIEPLRRLGVRLASVLMGRMDLTPRPYGTSFEDAVTRIQPHLDPALAASASDALAPLRPRPKIVEALRLALEDRDPDGTIGRATLARIHRTVEKSLAASRADGEGFHPRPPEPVEAFAFVGTRYAARTTAAMVEALRQAGYDDLGILDLAIAVADANQWARMHRLLDLPPALFYLGGDAGAASSRHDASRRVSRRMS